MRARLPAIGLVAGMAAGLIIPASAHDASAQTNIMLQQHDPNDLAQTRIRNGVEVLKRDRYAGPGKEQASFDCAPPAPGADRIQCIATAMSTGALASGDTVQRESWQGAVFPFEIVRDDSAIGAHLESDPTTARYITQRNADDYRAFNHPTVKYLKDGVFMIVQNWDRNNNVNTERYATFVRADGSIVGVTSDEPVRSNGEGLGQSVRIYDQNNDNVCMNQFVDAMECEDLPDGRIRCVESCGGNGNGRDNQWWIDTFFTVDAANDTVNVERGRDVSICLEEERSRGTCMITDGGIDVCFCTNGNSQPMREGVWAGAVDSSTGELLWRERLAHRSEGPDGRRLYAMRIACQEETDVNGVPTGDIICLHHNKSGNNRNGGRKGGKSFSLTMTELRPTREGPGVVRTADVTSLVTQTGVDLTHMALFFSHEGTVGAERPVLQLRGGQFYSGRAGAADSIVNIAVDSPTPELLQTRQLAIPGDTHLYANYLGGNPGNQGRDFLDMRIVRNPWANEAGATFGIPFYQLTVVAGKTTDDPKLKLDLLAEIWAPVMPAAVAEPTDETPQNDPTEPGDETPTGSDDPSTPSTDEPDTSSPSQTGSLGGCSAAGTGANGGFLLLIGLGLVLGLRRRRN